MGIQNLVEHLRWSFLQNSQQLLAVNNFHEKLHLRCSTGFWIRIWLKSYKSNVIIKFMCFLLEFAAFIYFCTAPEVFYKKGVHRNFTKFTGKHLCQSIFFNKVAGHCNFIKMKLWHRCFPMNFAKFLRTPFLQNTSGRLLLETVSSIK